MKLWALSLSLASSMSFAAQVLSEQDSAQVFSESTNFEQFVSEREAIDRSIASVSPMARVIGLKRELGLDDASASQAAQDVILNGGSNVGLSEGMELSVIRKVPVIDPYRENAQSELQIPFAKIEILHVDKEASVARLKKIDSIQVGLVVGNRGIMVGDFVGKAN
jgi:hypothetical protein